MAVTLIFFTAYFFLSSKYADSVLMSLDGVEHASFFNIFNLFNRPLWHLLCVKQAKAR